MSNRVSRDVHVIVTRIANLERKMDELVTGFMYLHRELNTLKSSNCGGGDGNSMQQQTPEQGSEGSATNTPLPNENSGATIQGITARNGRKGQRTI
jgi:hypothetical protein